MAAIPSLSAAQVDRLADLLESCGTHTDLNKAFASRGVNQEIPAASKKSRIEWVFTDFQRRDGCANGIMAFIQHYLAPARYVGKADQFNALLTELNTILAFSGMAYGQDGQFRQIAQATTIDEAERRANTLRSKFQGRAIHSEVLKYCKAELLQENYFHAVFEASKGLAQRIRDISGVQLDGAALVDKVFSVDRPILAFSSLQTETEKSEHKGFAMLLKGCFGAIRNPLAHEPKLLWTGEEDAADYLSLISLLHRRLDGCVKTGLS